MKDDFFSEENKIQSNWMKFEQIGDHIKGTLVSRSYKPARDKYPAQEVLELKVKTPYMINGKLQEVSEEGEFINVGISVEKVYLINRIRRFKLGQIIGFKFINTVKAKTKGHFDAKTIEPYGGGMDENYAEEVIKDEMGGQEINTDTIPM